MQLIYFNRIHSLKEFKGYFWKKIRKNNTEEKIYFNSTNEYELSVTAFESEEAYKQYQDTSKALDAFCSSVNFLDTVITNKAFDLVVDFCGETGDVQNSVKIFSPVLQDGQKFTSAFFL